MYTKDSPSQDWCRTPVISALGRQRQAKANLRTVYKQTKKLISSQWHKPIILAAQETEIRRIKASPSK
jgi:hypothetical protein